MTGTAAGRRLLHSVGDLVPQSFRRRLARLRTAYRVQSADRAFAARDLPDVTAAEDTPRHVVLVVVDALRTDTVTRELMPTLAELFETDAVAPAPWTGPSVSSLHSGQYPHKHGAIRQNDEVDDATGEGVALPPILPEDVVTLPELFAGAGYDTYAGFAFDTPFLALKGRFETHRLYHNLDCRLLFEDHLDWLERRTGGRTFSYLHLSDLHEPTDPPEEYWRRHDVDPGIENLTRWDYTGTEEGAAARRYRENKRRLYRASTDYVDDRVGKFLERLRRQVDEPVCLITSDHGEALWEHSEADARRFQDPRGAYAVGHGGTPYEAVARVPICAVNLEIADGPASLVDVFPTVLSRAGVDGPTHESARDLAEPRPADRPLLVESARYGHEKKATYQDGYKLLVSRGDHCSVGYSLPEERETDLPPDVEETLRSALPPWPDGGQPRRVDGAVSERLEDLGYR